MSLQEIEAQRRQAAALEVALRLERDNLIRSEIQAGITKAQVAKVTGLTRQRIGQIAEEE